MKIRKRKDFLVLTLILLIAIFFIIQGSSFEVWSFLPLEIKVLLFTRTNNIIFYDLSIGFFASYIFYIIVNFIPELKKEREARRKELPLRCARLREVQFVLYGISSLWIDIFKICINNQIINKKGLVSLNDLFNYDQIVKVLPYINLSQPAIIYEHIGQGPSWFEKIEMAVTSLKEDADNFLNRYNTMEPADLFFTISYLISKSFIIGQLPILTRTAFSLYGNKTTLEKCIAAENLKDDIDVTCKYIIDLNNWYSKEAEYLSINYPNGKTAIQLYSLMDELDK